MGIFQVTMERLGLSSKKYFALLILVLCCTLPILVTLIYQNLNFNLSEELSKAEALEKNVQNFTKQVLERRAQNITSSSGVGSKNWSIGVSKGNSSQSTSLSVEQLLHGLLAPGFDEDSCLSRYQSYLFRKASPYKPSPFLISKLRAYEDLHRRCGPHTKYYRRTTRKLRKSSHVKGPAKCNYVVWTPSNGLGNRIIRIASTFLYAVLTKRVLLVNFGNVMTGLFCEPFPNSSWLLPEDFRSENHPGELQNFNSLIEDNIANNSKEFLASFLFLDHSVDYRNSPFHCQHSQELLHKIPALILLSDQYFIPSLFMIPSFKKELTKLFPEKDAIFHHLGHYLFHPSNEAWGLITRFYKSYLAAADERIGLQIRVFNPKRTPYKTIMNQILSCTLKHKVLPEIDEGKTIVSPSKNRVSKAVLVASLYSNYTEKLRSMYWITPTMTGDVVGVYQASHEEYQKFNDNTHNMKAWAEIYLLSLCDALITSAQSTFGYVAQSLGGLKPFILDKANGKETPDPPCQQAMSMEPCFHFPPKYDCNAKTELAPLFPYMKTCEDFSLAVKLVDEH